MKHFMKRMGVGLPSAVIVLLCVALFPQSGRTQTVVPPVVKITALGSHAGEFCRNDRALLFEDPTGVRVLWDPGRTIAGGTDDRLGDVHVVILSHAHTDHVGDVKHNPASPGTCASPGTVTAAPNSNLADIVAAKNAAFIAGGEMADYFARKIQDVRGTATPGCAAATLTNEFVVPLSAPCTATLRPGGSRTARMNGAPTGVKLVVVQAFHSNGINPALTDDPGVAPGTTAYGGSEGGFIVAFTNGLTVYLTGDTGMFGDMKTIIRKYYKPNLMVVNISDTATFGPDEGAFATQKLVKPQSVIPSHRPAHRRPHEAVHGSDERLRHKRRIAVERRDQAIRRRRELSELSVTERLALVMLPGPREMPGIEQLFPARLDFVRSEEARLAGLERRQLQRSRLFEINGAQASQHGSRAQDRRAVSAQQSAGARPDESRQLLAKFFGVDQLGAGEDRYLAQQDGPEIVDHADAPAERPENRRGKRMGARDRSHIGARAIDATVDIDLEWSLQVLRKFAPIEIHCHQVRHAPHQRQAASRRNQEPARARYARAEVPEGFHQAAVA